MSNKNKVRVLLALCIIGFWLFHQFYGRGELATMSPEVIVPAELIPQSQGELVQHRYYQLSYLERYEQAEWVAYTLSEDHLTDDSRERPFFVEDPQVSTFSADWRNYKGSGYDRGHLCPAGDRRFSEAAYIETFYTSNISPQDRAFNAGIWNRLEQQIRSWAGSYGNLWVFTGGVLELNLAQIGDEGVAVPRQFYKIVVRQDGKGYFAIAFLMPNTESKAALDNFVVTIDRVEEFTGIDFFGLLPDSQQEQLESKIHKDSWSFR